MSVHITYDAEGNVTSIGFGGSEADIEPELEITIKADDTDPLKLALWIRDSGYKCNPTQALYIAKCIINGETWRPPYYGFDLNKENPYCNIKVIKQF